MFISTETRINRCFAKSACKVTMSGTIAACNDSTHAVTSIHFQFLTAMTSFFTSPPTRTDRQRLHLLALPLALGLGTLAACGQQADSSGTPAAKASGMSAAQAYDHIATQGKGFSVGALMAASPVYVLFDPQCPHCGHLWQASQALLPKVKFVWIPVSFINGKSAPQGAAILSASNPAEFMAAHETSILAGTGGSPLPASVAPEVEAVIKANTVLFNQLAVESVPYVVAKNIKSGQVVTNAGAMETAALAEFLGVN